MSKLTVKSTFLIVYISISIATFYHSMWGFATLQGTMPENGFPLFIWWFIGGLSAFAIDVGMGAIVYALLSGWETRWLEKTLYVLAFASAFTQLIFAAHHAVNYSLGTVPNWIGVWLIYILDARTIILPILLPAFAITYAFAAKIKEPEQISLDDTGLTEQTIRVLEFIKQREESGQDTTRADIYTGFSKSPSFATYHTKPLIELELVSEVEGKLMTNHIV